MQAMTKPLIALYSVLVTYIILVVIAMDVGAIKTLFYGLLMLAQADTNGIYASDKSTGIMFSSVLAVLVFTVPIMFLSGGLQKVLGSSSNATLDNNIIWGMTKNKKTVAMALIAIVAEEAIARWIFLGVFARSEMLAGKSWAIYVLFLLGNLMWIAMYVRIFRQRSSGSLRVKAIVTFVSSIFYTYLFIKYGFVASLMANMATTIVLMGFHKKQNTSTIDFVFVVYYLIVFIGSFYFLDHPIYDASSWLHAKPNFVLPGWSTGDYFAFYILAHSFLGLLFSILCYDRRGIGVKIEIKGNGKGIILGIGLVFLALLFYLFVLSFIGSKLEEHIAEFVIIWTVAFVIANFKHSGSAISMLFWTFLCTQFLLMCTIQAIGPDKVFVLFLLFVAVFTPAAILKIFDD